MGFQHVLIVDNYFKAFFVVVKMSTSLFLAPLCRKTNPFRKMQSCFPGFPISV